jgi:mannose-6-phosphate isomerase-like protein (cupin superfamily)
MGNQGKVARKKMQVFRFAEGAAVDQAMMPFLGVDETVMAGFGRLATIGIDRDVLEKTVCLFREPGENGMSLVYAWFKSGFILPKHSHDADCLYYVIAGSLKMGSVELGKGDGVFIPADFAYTYEVGPEGVEVLEFRTATKFHIHFKNNEPAHWDRMEAAQRRGAVIWPTERAPSENAVEPAE